MLELLGILYIVALHLLLWLFIWVCMSQHQEIKHVRSTYSKT